MGRSFAPYGYRVVRSTVLGLFGGTGPIEGPGFFMSAAVEEEALRAVFTSWVAVVYGVRFDDWEDEYGEGVVAAGSVSVERAVSLVW